MVKYYIIIGIIYTIPYIVTIVISGLRKKLETDRNFYGKTIDIQKYDWMFSDSSWYPEEAKKRNRFLSFCTYLNPNKRNSIFLPYFTIGILGIIINWMFNLIIK